jgi:hypothetical protein
MLAPVISAICMAWLKLRCAGCRERHVQYKEDWTATTS